MTDVAYTAAVFLAGVFAWAGLAKLADRRRTTATFAELGLPVPAVLGTAVPVTELALALGLLLVPAVAAFAALGLLAAFTTFLVRAVRAGSQVGCGCFGSARSDPVSSVEVARNLALACAAVVAGFATGPVLPGLDAVVLTTTAGALAAVLLALADLRRRTGHVFALDLALGPDVDGAR